MDRARRLISELENKLLQKETEFESYKDKIQSQSSETQLQAELGLMKLEKVREGGWREGGRREGGREGGWNIFYLFSFVTE